MMAKQNNAPISPEQDEYDDSVPPLWETVAKLGASIPAEEWDRVPTDLAANLETGTRRRRDRG
jgi:hypothetical protein